jgi:hypothetical protein
LCLLALCGLLAACAGEPIGLPDLATAAAESYLKAWQAGDWERIYRFEGRGPESRSVLHRALSDRLLFYQVTEVRYADSAAACAVTLRWRTPAGTYSETGELYLHRRGPDWHVAGYRNF